MAMLGEALLGEVRLNAWDPSLPDDIFKVPPWDDDSTNQYLVGPDDTIIEVPADRVHIYRLEVHNADGELVATILEWWDGEFKQVANQGDTLKFTVAYDNPQTALLSHPYSVWLRERHGHVLGQFIIGKRVPIQDGDERTLRIECSSRLNQLANEVVTAFATTSGGDDVLTILGTLLSAQVQTPAIGIGDIDPVIGETVRELSIARGTVLSIIRQVQSTLPKETAGYIYVDAWNRLCWKQRIGSYTGQVLMIGKNMTGVTVDENWDDLCTRIFMYGEGEDPATCLKLTDAGLSTEYLDSPNTAVYGIRPAIRQDKRIRYGETLLVAAQRELDERDTPLMVYQVSVLDLAVADGERFDGWEDLYMGSGVRVVAVDLDVDDTIEIASITRRLDDPLNMTVEVENRSRNLGDLFRDLIEQQSLFDVNDDGSRYPNVARIYTTGEPDAYRNGDWRYVAGDPEGHMEFYDNGTWREVGGGGDGSMRIFTVANEDERELLISEEEGDQEDRSELLDGRDPPETGDFCYQEDNKYLYQLRDGAWECTSHWAVAEAPEE